MDFPQTVPAFPHNILNENAFFMALSHFRNGYLSIENNRQFNTILHHVEPTHKSGVAHAVISDKEPHTGTRYYKVISLDLSSGYFKVEQNLIPTMSIKKLCGTYAGYLLCA